MILLPNKGSLISTDGLRMADIDREPYGYREFAIKLVYSNGYEVSIDYPNNRGQLIRTDLERKAEEDYKTIVEAVTNEETTN